MKVIPILLFLSIGFFLWRGLSSDPHHLPSVQIGKSLPQFSVPQLLHPEKKLTARDFSQKVTLLNVWASWCEACKEEQVFLMQLAAQGVRIYGLDYKDKPVDAVNWLEQWGNPYRVIGQDLHGDLGIDLGVYGVPETFIIDKQGRIQYRHVGIMNQEAWLKLAPIVRALEKGA